ncbi:MAG: CRISPR-associated endonuclease Cas2 [Candidatus Niyogibacteria bacterium]|nr:CRISPR-associated endonuclease Cas2 [Candidatus Niyogibacteria bacterium]
MEKEVAKKFRRDEIKKIILASVALAGILSVGLVAPNVLGAMGKLGILPHRRQKESINRSRDHLIKRGLLEYVNRKLHLTLKGEAALRRLELAEYKMRKPKRWDSRWRVLIFDIPEKRKKLRDQVRRTLIEIGFVRAQDSVWIYPYDCEDLIALLKADFRIGKDLLYLVVEQMEYDRPYKKLFGLK